MGLQDMMVYNREIFRTGDLVTCRIDQGHINDARIYVAYYDEVNPRDMANFDSGDSIAFICHNRLFQSGCISPNLLGYQYSWIFIIKYDELSGIYSCTDSVTNLQHQVDVTNQLEKIIDLSFPGRK
jgi:hypothetical protein